MNYAKKAPAFVLASAGYDVWLGNSRGNKYSRHHNSLDPDNDFSFWNYTLVEMGEYDVPSNMNYIIKQTGFQKLAIIGHSQGTSQILYALANNMTYMRNHVSIHLSFAPVSKMNHIKSGIFKLKALHMNFLKFISYAFGVYEFYPDGFLG